MNKHLVLDIFNAALREADPYRAVARHAAEIGAAFRQGRYEGMYVLGFGKAAMGMARAVMDSLGDTVVRGIAITKRDDAAGVIEDRRVTTYEAGHPLPDENGIAATREIIRLARSLDEGAFVVCLISGGASALLVAPRDPVSLVDKQVTTDLLLKAGADIRDLNTVRKHISAVKGGRLAEMAYPATVHSLILSDVIGDRLDVIGSGPTFPDGTTYGDALDVLAKFGLAERVPRPVFDLLSRGARGELPETPKPGDPLFEMVRSTIVGSNSQAVAAAKRRAEKLGFAGIVVSTDIHGEARDAGAWLARKAKEFMTRRRPEPLCLVSGGETTVTVKGTGMGGRNMELALAFALEVEGEEGITLLSAGTDGGDGPTDAAGAIVDGNTIAVARGAGLDPVEYLRNNDSYNFFKQIGALVKTGPTGTNVMDLQIIALNWQQPIRSPG